MKKQLFRIAVKIICGVAIASNVVAGIDQYRTSVLLPNDPPYNYSASNYFCNTLHYPGSAEAARKCYDSPAILISFAFGETMGQVAARIVQSAGWVKPVGNFTATIIAKRLTP